MDKNLKIVVIVGVVIILVFVGLIINLMLEDNTHEEHVVNDEGVEVTYNTDDYIINQSTNIYADTSARIGEDSRVLAALESINADNNEVISLSAREANGNLHELLVDDMKMMDINYNGTDEVNLTFRTGGTARVILGSYMYLYKSQDGSYSLDDRSQFGGVYETLTATIADFEFTPMEHQNGHLMLSYIVLEANGQQIKLPASVLGAASFTSNGELTVYYVGDTATDNIYSVRTSDNFWVTATMHDGSAMSLAKGSQINVQKSSLKGYWEMANNIDSTKIQANIIDIEFDSEGENITGINYIVLALGDGSQIKMTMLHTGAAYGTPSGNYERSYSSDGHDMVISDVTPAADWKMELNYADGTALELRISSNVWIYKTADGIYVLDYIYTSQSQ